MNNIWWTQIPNAAMFIQDLVHAILDGRSVIINNYPSIPWYNDLQEEAARLICDGSPTRGLEYLDAPAGEPGKYLLNNYCKPEKRNKFRPLKGYPAFLAEADDITLNDCILWIRGLSNSELSDWITFIRQYNKFIPQKRYGATFILEAPCQIEENGMKGIEIFSVERRISDFDNYLFNMMMASNVNGPAWLKQYLAELSLSINNFDLELSSYCVSLEYCDKFIEDPYQTLSDICQREQKDDGSALSIAKSKNQIGYDIWNAQVRFLFPVIEKFRREFVSKYEPKLATLHLRDAQGNQIDDPADIEIGTLHYAASNKMLSLSSAEYSRLSVYKEARNKLAHIKALPFRDIKELMT